MGAWKSGGAINILGGRTVAKNSILKISMIDSSFTDNKVSQGNGGAIKVDKGSNNGDYMCRQETCDTRHFKASIKSTFFGNNYAGKAFEFSDVDGNSEVEDDVAAWRHVDNFDSECNDKCCNPNVVGNIKNGYCIKHENENSKCRDHGRKQYTCNDGLYLEGTKTTNLCTISAKSTTKCPAGYHQGRMPGRCIPCEPGRYQGTSTLDSDRDATGEKITECEICPSGTYSVGTSVDGNRLALACTDCEAGRYQDKKEQTSCNECGAVIANSDGVEIGAASSSVCSCAKTFFDARVPGSYNESDTTELDPNDPDETRCQLCPRIGGETGDVTVDCTTPGQTRDSLVTLRGFYRQNKKTLKFFRCTDVDYPGVDPSTSRMCLGGVAGEGVGEERTTEER